MRKKAGNVTLELGNKLGNKVTMVFNPEESTISFDRRESGIVDFSQDFPAVTVAPTFSDKNKLSLRLFIDRSSIELFDTDGKFVMTNLVFPQEPYTTLSVKSDNKAQISGLQIFPLNPASL